MAKRTLHIDIQEDNGFISAIETNIRRRWIEMSGPERKVVGELLKALNDARQATTKELLTLLPSPQTVEALEKLVNNLRSTHQIPVIVTVGRKGGYRLPVCRAECTWFIGVETAVIMKKAERLVAASGSMQHYGVTVSESIASLATLLKIQRIKAVDGEETQIKKSRPRR